MKKIIVSIILTLLISTNVNVFASALPPVVADGALLVDMNSGKILYEKNKDEKFYPASVTKIMTALLVLEKCKLDEVVTVGKKPPFIDGNKIYIFEGEQLTIEQMLYALMVESANDVASALAEYISGSEEAFGTLMTQRAEQLGCTNTNFTNPHGLHDPNHYTTAYDLSLIAREAMKNDMFRKLVSTKYYVVEPSNKQPEKRYLYINNQILLNSKFHIDGANGIKVGYTDEAGHSFVGSAFSGDTKMMVVLLHDKKPGMWEDAFGLLNYGLKSYETIKEVSAGEYVASLKAPKSEVEVPLVAERDLYYTRPVDAVSNVSTNVVLSENYKGYIVKGQKIGVVEYSVMGTKIGSVNLLAANDLLSTFYYSYKNDSNGNLKKIYSSWLLLPGVGLLAIGTLAGLKIMKRKK